MADQKISELSAAGALDGSELVPVVQSGATTAATAAAIAAIAAPAPGEGDEGKVLQVVEGVPTWVTPDFDGGSGWTRPADWLPITPLTTEDEKFVGLFAVYDNDANYLALTCEGDYVVDWGDGSTPENVASGVQAEHQYDYADLTGTDSERGYRQAIVTIAPQAESSLTAVRLYGAHSEIGRGLFYPFLDVEFAGSALAEFKLRDLETVISGGSNLLLERVASPINAIMNASVMFGACYALQSIPLLDTSSVTNMSAMFVDCYALQSIPLLDTSSVTDMSVMFGACYALQSIPLLDTSSVTDASSMFGACYALQSIPLLDTSSVTNASSMFVECYALQSIPLLDTSSVTTADGMFGSCTSLAVGATTGMSVDIDYSNCNLSRDQIVAIFNGLADLNGGSATITVTGNRGVADLSAGDIQIATDKDWTVVTV